MLDCKEYSIILVGSAALPATIEILEDKGEELRKRYSKRYLDEAYVRLIEYRKIQEASAKAFFVGNALGVSSMCSLDDDKIQSEPYLIRCGLDGVFGALYRLGDMLKTGLRARLFDIPIDQVTIELCDYVDINPYEADAGGAFIIASDSHGRMLDELNEKGIPAKLIGYTTRDNSRIVLGPTERYLTK